MLVPATMSIAQVRAGLSAARQFAQGALLPAGRVHRMQRQPTNVRFLVLDMAERFGMRSTCTASGIFDHHVCLVQAIMKLLTSLTLNVASQALLVA